jgi:DNA-directed RNA polymerase subunit RPC12/RpoP
MEKRFEFKCWKCERTYTLFREITDEQELIVACPFCNAEGVVDLKPFRKKVETVLKGIERKQDLGDELQLPNILPTQPKDQ